MSKRFKNFSTLCGDIDSYCHMLELTKYKGYNTPKEKLIAWESFYLEPNDVHRSNIDLRR